jgi:hypothetical protein
MTDRAAFLSQRIASARERERGTSGVRALLPQPLLPRIAAPEPVREWARAPLGEHVGVWRFGVGYKRSDCTSYGGQLWLAICDTSAKPGDSGDWRLIVRRGAPGADGQDGASAQLVDARATFDRDQVTHQTTKVTLRALDTNEMLATMTPQHDAEGFLESATIKWAVAA